MPIHQPRHFCSRRKQVVLDHGKQRSTRRFGVIILAVLASMLSTVGWPQSEHGNSAAVRIGYVDLKRLLDNAPQMVTSRARLEAEFASRDKALKADDTHLSELKQRWTKDAAIMSKSDADALKREVDALERSLKRTREELRNELNTRAATERDRVWQDINNTVLEFAREQGYDLILPSPVVYASGRIDITEQILERLKHSPSSPAGKP